MHAPASRKLAAPAGIMALAFTLAGAFAVAACSAPSSENGTPTPPGGSSSGSSGTSGASGSSGTSGASGSSGTSGTSGSSGAACVGTGSKAEPQEVDLFVMLDRSLSMAGPAGTTTRWGALTSAVSSFVGQPLDRTSVGLGYFPFHVGGFDSCNAADYANPAVEIGPLAQTASQITASMASQTQFLWGTPTLPALQGAIDHARAWASMPAHAGHAVVVVYATDGDPIDCDLSLDRVNAVAAAGVSATPSIRTFVIGVGPLLSNLNGIARAGGTTSAFMVDASSSASDQFLKALNDIRGSAIRCTYTIPPPPAGQTLDPGKVNVEYRAGGGAAARAFRQVPDQASCGTRDDAWSYDAPAAPTTIQLCPSTCAAIEADKAGAVDVVLGCKTAEW